jgi:serpin B
MPNDNLLRPGALTTIGLTLLLLGLLACRARPAPVPGEAQSQPGPAPVGATAGPPAADPAAVAAGSNAFALDLYAQIRGTPGNLFFSPVSLSTALTLTYAGARGDTAVRAAKAMHLDLERSRLHRAAGALSRDLVARARKSGAELAIANRLWVDRGVTLVGDYVALAERDYGAAPVALDFAGRPEASSTTINDWVARQTANRIKDLVSPGILGEVRLILTNAVYFKGTWKARFERSDTEEQPFFVARDGMIKAPLMYQKGDFGYAAEDDATLVELPYAGGEFSMVVVLPRARDGLPALEAGLTPKNLERWLARLREEKVHVYLPRFRMEAGRTSDFAPMLKSLGLPLDGDFSGISSQESLRIKHVLHKGFVDVNEEGTEAAAATAVIVSPRFAEPSPPTFRADHPFLFLVRATASGAILFLGRLVDPSNGSAPVTEAAPPPPTANAALRGGENRPNAADNMDDVLGLGGGGAMGAATAQERATGIVRMGETVLEGIEDGWPVVKEIDRRLSAIKGCYDRALKRNPYLRGIVGVRWTINPAGDVAAAEIEEDSLGDKEVVSCVKRLVRHWRFPAPATGSVDVLCPFIFE